VSQSELETNGGLESIVRKTVFRLTRLGIVELAEQFDKAQAEIVSTDAVFPVLNESEV
jgi:hypothetical protein